MDDALLNEAVSIMKSGYPPDAAYGHLLSRGVSADEARAAVDKLVALKHEAEAKDPARIREEAKWMFLHGASVDDVVAKMTSVGIAAEHARPEAERIAAAVRAMVPCERCRAPMNPKQVYFDPQGRKICARCNAGEEIAASERRGLSADLEMVGFGPLIADAVSDVASAPASAPFCQWCGSYAMHVSYLHPSARAGLDPRWSYVCNHCVRPVA